MSRIGVAAALAASALLAMPATAFAKAPGATYCFRGFCHRVLTLAETAARIGRDERVTASHYDHCAVDRFNSCGLTSSGEAFRPDAPDNAASPIYPDGTLLVLFNPATGRAAAVRVNNAGPYIARRRLDVSRATAEALGFAAEGVAELDVRVVAAPRAADARYRGWRRYAPAPGHLGWVADLDAAHDRAAALAALYAIGGGDADALRLALAAQRTPPPPHAAVPLAPPPQPPLAASEAPAATPPAPLLARATAPAAIVHALAAAPPLAAPTPPTAVVLIADEVPETWSAAVAGLADTARAKARHGVRPTAAADLPLRTASLALTGLGDLAGHFVRQARDSARAGVRR